MSFDNDIDVMDSIEACRTCGVFFLTSSSLLRQIFTSAADDPEMLHIRMELTAWNIEINENDGYPQFICTGCIHEFQKVFNFRRACIDIQDQLRHFYTVRNQNQNKINIKTELPDEVESVSDFIYVDDLSDTEYDGTTPFNIPHAPIKEEMYEAAVPIETTEETMDSANTNDESEKIRPPSSHIKNDMASALIPAKDIGNKTLDQDESTVKAETIDEAHGEEESVVAVPTSTSFVKCEFCNCISPNVHQHKLHMKRIHETRDMECHICGKKFKNSSSTRLKFHLKWHKISKHIKCPQCGFYCSSREMLREHTKQMHSKVSCSICGKSCLSKRMKLHMRTHGLDTLFECTYCKKVFTTSAAVSAHINQAHTVDTLAEEDSRDVENICVEIACAICDQKFINQIDLKLHVGEQHIGDVNNDSTKCEDEYSLMFSTNSTVATGDCSDFQDSSFSMRDDALSQIFCPNCHKNFFDPNDLAKHMTQCQLYMENESAEIYHSEYNGGDNQYTADCQNQAQNIQESNYDDDPEYVPLPVGNVENSAENDEIIDEAENFNQALTFGCAECAETFENVEELRDHHKNSHAIKSNFKCNVCGKVFELKFSLNRHMKKHENN